MTSAFQAGYDNYVCLNSSDSGADVDAATVDNIEAEMKKLDEAMNEPARRIDQASVDLVKGFAAERWHFDPAARESASENMAEFEYIMDHVFKTGMSAPLVGAVLEVAPEICGIIYRLIEEGEVDVEQFKRLGMAALGDKADEFIRGTVTRAIINACQTGLIEGALTNINVNVIAAITVIAMNTIKNACLLAMGKINRHEFVSKCAENLFITVCSFGMGVAGAAAASAMFSPAAAVLGYLIGSFVGSVVGALVYTGVYSCVIAFCVESGSTFFGFVDQNYELPNDIFEKIGAKVFEYEKFKPKTYNYNSFQPKRFEYNRFEPIKIDVTFLRRGVIEVGVIGYVG